MDKTFRFGNSYFEDSSSNPGSGGFQAQKLALATSYMFDNLSNWNTFDKTVTADHIDGVKIQTDSTHGFYLTYQTLESGTRWIPILK